MSDKKIALLNKEQAEFDKAQAEFKFKSTVIRSLPDDIPMPSRLYASGYCSDVCMIFDAVSLQEILRAFPAVPVTFIKGDSVSVKPTSALRDSDRGKRRSIYPVINESRLSGKSQSARWWTKICDDGLMAEITIENLNQMEIYTSIGEDGGRYEPAFYSFSTGSTGFWMLAKKKSSDLGLLSPLEKWKKVWAEVSGRHGWNSEQMRFVNDVIEKTAYGYAFELPPREESKSPYSYNFWLKFSDSDAEHLVELVNERELALPVCREEIKQSMLIAEVWFKDFFAARGNPFPHYLKMGCESLEDDASETFRYLFHKETGLAGIINWVTDKRGGGDVEVGYTMDKAHIRINCRYQQDIPAVDWESLVEYR